jgi:hypothetical protein
MLQNRFSYSEQQGRDCWLSQCAPFTGKRFARALEGRVRWHGRQTVADRAHGASALARGQPLNPHGQLRPFGIDSLRCGARERP